MVYLGEAHKIAKPKVIVSSSGGAAVGAFFLAKRFAEMRQWTRLFDDPEFISWKRITDGPVMDIDVLIDRILSKQAPKLGAEVAATKAKYFIAAQKFPCNSRHWFSHESAEPLFEQLRATKTMPGVSRLGVEIGGAVYADGCLAVSNEECVAKAFAEGAEQVILIDCSVHGRLSAFSRNLLRYGVRRAPEYIKAAIETFCTKVTKPMLPGPQLYVCRPKTLPTRHGLVRSFRINQATFEQGYADMARLCETMAAV
jgi:predicted acylesterase/phospholipase RssA